ncbi:MAG: 50S ribosomal protein L13 [Chloroflexi bacterium RBG_16_56_11]|nr:MAG: 50S ribosomal protein L13 [Chloroflexi bacterium RBG_16_56_11]
MKTFTAKPADIKRDWHIIDAADKTLGRLSSQVARLLMGKHKPIYSPAQDTGDFVVVINAARVHVTGKKAQQKVYYRHSGYPGGLRSITLEKMMQQFPTRAIKYSVEGMIPHTHLGRQMKKRLRIFAGAEHPYQSQSRAEIKKEA